MPTVSRFLKTVFVACALAYAAMYALTTLVEPKQSRMTVQVPLDRLNTAP